MARHTMSLAVVVVLLAFTVGCGSLKRLAYAGFGRDDWQQPERVVETLGIDPGMRVADVGAGGGYFTFRLAEAVGAEGRVYAVDVDADMLEHLREEAVALGHENVEVVAGEFGDPKLPDGAVDLVFTVNTYHHLDDPVAYFGVVRGDLAPGGRVAILDYSEPPMIAGDHWSEPDEILQAMQAAGFERIEDHDFIDRQSFQVFAVDASP